MVPNQASRAPRLFLVLTYLVITACGDRSYAFAIGEGTEFTESLAVELSRQCLDASGIDTSHATLEPYGGETGKEKLFARNAINPNDGYVMWKTSDQPGADDYTVFLERKGESVECRVARNWL
jgi:hypothetical protein